MAEKCDDILQGRRTNSKYRVHKVVLTGGPCGGKTTAQEHLQKFFEERGWKVFVVPETPTIFINGGVRFAELNPARNFVFQQNLLRAQMNVEAVFFRLAETMDKNCVVICDRGTNDIRAYIDKESWNKLRGSYGLSDMEVRDQRYDQVIHLTTAADGTDFYTLSTNTARSETAEQALQLDVNTRNAWIGHPRLDIVDNQGTTKFPDKMNKVLRVVCDRMGIPLDGKALPPAYATHKWKVSEADVSKLPTPTETFEIQCNYLKSNGDIERFLIKKSQDSNSLFEIKSQNAKTGEVTRALVTEKEYTDLLASADHDSSKKPAILKRTAFFHESIYFFLDVAADSKTLTTYSNQPVDQIPLPPSVKVQ